MFFLMFPTYFFNGSGGFFLTIILHNVWIACDFFYIAKIYVTIYK